MKLPPELRAIAPRTKKPKTPPPPRVTGPVAFPVFRRLTGMKLQRGGNDRERHFMRSVRVRREKGETWRALGLCPDVLPGPLVVTITRVAPGVLDTDNLAGAAKSVRDAIAHWLGLDDGKAERAGLVLWQVAQRKGGKGVWHVEIDIRTAGASRLSAVELLTQWQAKGCPPAAVLESPTEVF